MEDKSLTSMVITVIVALIVTGAVLVPVIGGFTDNDGGNDGGDSGEEGSGSNEVIITMGDFYSQYFDEWEYESLRTYSPYADGTSPFDIDSEDIQDIVNSFRAMGVEDSLFNFPIMTIYADGLNIYADFTYNVAQGGGDEYTIRLFVTTETDSFTLFVYDDESNKTQYNSSFSFRCGSSQATFEYQYYEGESTVSDSISVLISSIQLEFLLSKNQAGFLPDTMSYDGSENSWLGAAIFKDQTVLLDCSVEPTGERHEEIIPVSIEDFDNAIATRNVTFTGTKDSREYSVNSGVYEDSIEGWYILDNIQATVNVSPPYDEGTRVYYMGMYLSNYAGDYTGDDGDSGDSGSDLGTVGMIMAVIPIFVVLAILIYAVQYLRTKPESY